MKATSIHSARGAPIRTQQGATNATMPNKTQYSAPPNLSSYDLKSEETGGFVNWLFGLPPINWLRTNLNNFFDSPLGAKLIGFLSSQLAFANEVAGALNNSGWKMFENIYPHEGHAKWPALKMGIDLAALSGIILAGVSMYRETTHELMKEARHKFNQKLEAIHQWYLDNIKDKTNEDVIALHHKKVELIHQAEEVFHEGNKKAQAKGILTGFLQGVNYSIFSFLITSGVIKNATKLAQGLFKTGEKNILVNLFGSVVLGIGSLELGVRIFEKFIPSIVKFFTKSDEENKSTN